MKALALPRVAAVMLTRDRPAMAKRAIEAVHSQTYGNTSLFVLDTGKTALQVERRKSPVYANWLPGLLQERHTIGKLRNLANGLASNADIIVHFDDDDVSHPRRIEEQVALLQESKDFAAVGYNEVVFWDTRSMFPGSPHLDDYIGGEAWLYTNPNPQYIIGSSMCYWREAWERWPFEDRPHEDRAWQCAHGAFCLGVSAIRHPSGPSLICSIHGSNTEAYDAKIMAKSDYWRRRPEFDALCRERMKL